MEAPLGASNSTGVAAAGTTGGAEATTCGRIGAGMGTGADASGELTTDGGFDTCGATLGLAARGAGANAGAAAAGAAMTTGLADESSGAVPAASGTPLVAPRRPEVAGARVRSDCAGVGAGGAVAAAPRLSAGATREAAVAAGIGAGAVAGLAPAAVTGTRARLVRGVRPSAAMSAATARPRSAASSGDAGCNRRALSRSSTACAARRDD